MTTVLVTGAGGFLGSHIAGHLLKHTDFRVVATDSFRHNGAAERLAHLSAGHRLTVVRHDLTARFQFQAWRPDVIVSVASRCSVDESIASPADSISGNVEAVLTVAELARQARPRITVHLSTDEVYGGEEPGDGRHFPSNPYSASKAAQEDILRAYARTYGLPVTIVSSANMFGERQSQLAFVPRLIRAAVKGEPVTLHVSGGKPGRRWYTYAGNVASFVTSLIPAGAETAFRHIHLPGQVRLDNDQLRREIEYLTGLPVPHHLTEAASIRPGYDFEYGHLPQEAEWQPGVSAEEGLSRTVKWFLTHQEWL